MMNHRVGGILDQFFNPGISGKDRKTGFVLMVFPFEPGPSLDGRCNTSRTALTGVMSSP